MASIDLRGYTPNEFERQFNPRVAVPDHQAKIDARAAASAAALGRLERLADLRYGPNPNEILDIYPAPGPHPAPVQLYIHGGYWRAQDKADFAFLAEPLVAAGATAVLVNYDLCPTVPLAEVVAETMRAIAWTWRNIRNHGGDPDRIFISGSSAGAHLCAMALAHDWTADGLPADVIKGAVPVSGIYDVTPVLAISVNEQVRLDPESAERLSPLSLPPRRALPLLVAVGGGETQEWIRQSKDYVAMCQAHGVEAEYMELAGADHFDMTAVLADPARPLLPALLRQMGLGG